MAVFVNSSSTVGQFIVLSAENFTGDVFTSILLALVVLILLLVAVGIPLEWTAIIVLPLLITGMAFSSAFLPLAGVTLFYLGIIFAKVYFTNR